MERERSGPVAQMLPGRESRSTETAADLSSKPVATKYASGRDVRPLSGDEAEEHVVFSCNICYEVAAEPVVTLCGHLYCWPCLYRWLQIQAQCRTCPVCKAGVDVDRVVPIYGHGGGERVAAKPASRSAPMPPRPLAQRAPPVVLPAQALAQNMGDMQQHIGILPALFGIPTTAGTGAFVEPLTQEQQHQAFLSRLLLMLGSFVIMCLLLF